MIRCSVGLDRIARFGGFMYLIAITGHLQTIGKVLFDKYCADFPNQLMKEH